MQLTYYFYLSIEPVLIQTWFPGVHCHVGGGWDQNMLGDISLAWMIDNCMYYGLLDFNNIQLERIVTRFPGQGSSGAPQKARFLRDFISKLNFFEHPRKLAFEHGAPCLWESTQERIHELVKTMWEQSKQHDAKWALGALKEWQWKKNDDGKVVWFRGDGPTIPEEVHPIGWRWKIEMDNTRTCEYVDTLPGSQFDEWTYVRSLQDQLIGFKGSAPSCFSVATKGSMRSVLRLWRG